MITSDKLTLRKNKIFFFELMIKTILLVSIIVLINIVLFYSLEDLYKLSFNNNGIVLVGVSIIYTLSQLFLFKLLIRIIDRARYPATSLIVNKFRRRINSKDETK